MNQLFVYGSLKPGCSNEHVLTPIGGTFTPASVRGRLLEAGWGAGIGFPGLILDDGADPVEGFLFTSPALDRHWGELDRFEGAEYRRVETTVQTADGETSAYVYVIRDP